MALLTVRGLTTSFSTDQGIIRAVSGVSFTLEPGEVLGLVGESGSGKSVTALSIMRLVRDPPGRIVAGQVIFEGQDVLKLDAQSMRQLRGNRISMIFQEPLNHLDPLMKAGDWIAESLMQHKGMGRKAAIA